MPFWNFDTSSEREIRTETAHFDDNKMLLFHKNENDLHFLQISPFIVNFNSQKKNQLSLCQKPPPVWHIQEFSIQRIVLLKISMSLNLFEHLIKNSTLLLGCTVGINHPKMIHFSFACFFLEEFKCCWWYFMSQN